LLRKYGRDGKKETVKEAKRHLDQAVLNAPTGHPDRAYVLNQHACCLWSLYEFSDGREDLDQAIQDCREAVDISNHQFDISMTLASVLRHRGLHEREIADVNEAIDIMNGVLGEEPEGTVYASSGGHELGYFLQKRYERRHDISDLVKAIEEMRLCVKLAPADCPNKPFSLDILAVVLAMYDAVSEEEHLSEAIEVIEQAIKLLDIDHPDRQHLDDHYHYLRRKKARRI
jgi:tetratricopeptide (TPR) repeat protein